MSYKGTLDEIRKKYGISEDSGNAPEGSQQKKSYQETLSSLIEKYSSQPVRADRFNSMISDYNSFLEDSKKDYDAVDWSSSGELSEKNTARIAELGDAARELYRYYFTGEGRNEAYAAQNRGQLQEIINNLRSMGSDWKSTGDYYRQWEDEDSWNEYQKITGLQEKYNWHTTQELEAALEEMPTGEDRDYLSYLYNTLSVQEVSKALKDAETKYFDLRDELIESYPDMEMNGNYVHFNSEMSDLQELVDEAKEDYDALRKQKEEMYDQIWVSEKYAAITQEAKSAPDFAERARSGWDMYLADQEAAAEDKRETEEWFSRPHFGVSGIEMASMRLATDDTYKQPDQRWTQEQRDVFGALYGQDKEKAEQFAIDINNAYNSAQQERQQSDVAAFAGEHPVLSTAGSLFEGATGLGMADFLTSGIEKIARGTITQKGFVSPHQAAETATGTISQNLNDQYGTISGDIPILGGHGLGDAYQLMNSIITSAATVNTVGPLGTDIIFFGNAASSAMDDAKQRGATDEESLLMGLISGTAEAAGEHFSASHLLEMTDSKTIKKFFGSLFGQALEEGEEELFTSFVNNLADNYVMRDKSNFYQYVDDYMQSNPNATEEEAKKEAWKQMWSDMAFDALGGFVSGGFHTVWQIGGMEARKALNYHQIKQIYGGQAQALVDEALEIDPESKAAQKAQEILKGGKNLSGRQIYNLVHSNEQTMAAQDKAAIQTAAQNRLTELGETGDVAKASAALAKQAAGEKLNRSERRAIRYSKYGQQVAAELNPETKFKDGKAPEWVGKIGTSRLNTDVYNRAVETSRTPQEAETARNAPVSQENNNPVQASTGDAVEPFYTVSDSGETTRLSTGETVQIQEVAEAGDGGMKLRMEDGTLVDADDVGYATREDALLYESVADLGADAPAANALINTYKSHPGNVSVEDYTAGAAAAFQAGMRHIPVSQLAQDPLASKLTDTQRNAAYAAGRNYSRRASEAKEASIKQSAGKTSKTSKSEGKVHFDRKGRTFSKAQETGIKTMEILSKAIGTDFYVFESYEKDGERVYLDENGNEKPAPNGFYDPKTGAIHIDLNAGSGGRGTVLYTLSHELTHFIRQWSPAKFDTLAEAVMRIVYEQKNINVKERIQAQQAKAQQTGITLTEDEAYEEMIADSMETILRDGNVLNDLMAEIKQKDTTLWEKIKQWFQDLAGHIRRTIDAYKDYAPDSYEGRAVASMEKYLEALEGYYADALSTAGENYRSIGEKNNSPQKAESFSLREFNDGRRYVDVETDEHTFDGLTLAEMNRRAKAILMERFAGKVVGIDNKAFVNGDSVNEYVFPSKFIAPDIRKAKLTAASELDNLLDAGQALPNEPDGRDGHIHPDAIDFSYFKTTFKIGQEYFEGIVNIKNIKRGKLLKDITKIRNITKDIVSSYGENPKSNFLRNASMDSIFSSPQNVKEKFSLRDTVQGEGVKYQARAQESFTPSEINAIQNIGRKSINSFTSTDISATERFAQRYWHEMGAKSPFFRAWFGDWRANDQSPVQIANRPGDVRGIQHNDDTGWDIQVSGKVFNETKAHASNATKNAQPYLSHINDIVKKAVLLDSFGVGKAKSNNSLLMHNMYAVADIGNGPELLKLYVEEMNDPNAKSTSKRAYQLQNIEKQQLNAKGSGISPSPVISTATIHNVADLYAVVKQHDKNLYPNPASAIVNSDGTPKIMYHGSRAQFTAFDRSKAKSSGLYGKGFYFTDSRSHAGTYGNLYAVYLNIRNPLKPGGGTVSRAQVRTFLEAVAENEDYSIENYGTYDVDSILGAIFGGKTKLDAFKVIQDINATAIGDFAEAIELFNQVNGTKFDGIITSTETVAFSPTQIKSATDNIGTFDKNNPDIRYSLRDSAQEKSVKALQNENDRLKEDVSRLKELVKLQGKLTYGKLFSENYIENAARNLKKIADADGKTRELTDLLRKMYNDIGNGPDARFDRLEEAAKPVVDWLWENKRSYLDPYAETVLDDLKGRKITISKQQAGEIFSSFDSLEAYRKRLSGTVRLVQMGTEGAMDLDSFWQEMADAYPGTFDADISDADMPEALADIVGRLQSMSQKDYEQESPEVQDAMRQELFYEVYQTFWNARITKTVADKKQEEIDLLVEEHEVQMRELKASHAETVSELKAAKETAMKKLREDTKRSQEVRKHRRNIEKKAKKLMDALVKNSDKEHIPEALKGVVGDFLNSIDFSSKSLTKKGTPTKRDISYTEALGRLREVLQKQENLVNGVTDGNLLNDFYMDLPTGFAQAVQEHIEKVTAAAKGLDPSTNQVFAMGAEELQNLDYILTVITRSVSQMNKLLANAHFQTTAEAAQTSILDFKALGKDKDRGKGAGGVYRFLQWHNATPYYVFKRMGEGAQSVFEGLQDGWDKLAFNAQAIIDFAEETYTAKEVKAWTEDVKTVELSSGKKIRLTAAQLMSIYCLSQREQGKRHLFGGGIRIGDFETKQKTGKAQVSDAENYTLTVGDVATLNGLLSDRQKAVADKLQKYMNTVGTKWGNEVSMTRFGYQAFTEDNYFPIQSDSSNLPTMNTDSQNTNNLYRLLNLSMTKGLNKHANNAVIVNSIFDVFADHMSDMAKYNALALPVLDAMKWYNYKVQTKNENGQVDAAAVKKSMESAFGKSANSYFMNLIKDINGTNEGGKGTDRLTRKMISNYKIAAVAGNLRVALLQPTAYVRATAVLNPKYLTRGLAVNPVKAAQEAEKYSGIAAWKSMGFYDTGIARGIREQIKHDTGIKDALVEKSMKAAEWGDRLTWGVLWNACKLEVQETQHLSGEALLEATSKRFRDVVYRTQVVDSTMTRSQSMRDTTGLSVYTTAFMAEPTLSFNMLLDVYSGYTGEIRRTGDKGAAWGKVKNAFVRTLVSYTLTNLAAALAEGLMDAWRDDDEYEKFLEKFLEHFKDNFWDDMNPLTKLPVIKEILSFLEGYDNGRMDTEWAKNLVYAYNIWAETVALKTGAQEKATSITYNGKMTLYGKLYNTLKAMSQAVGMPFSNTMREVASFWNNTVGVITGKKLRTYDPGPASQIKYAYLDGYLTQEEATQELLKLDPKDGGAKDTDDAYFKIQRWETDKGRYAALDTALQQDQSIDAAVKDLTAHGIKPEEVQSHIKSTVGGWYKDNAISREAAISMLKKNTDLDSTAAVAKWDWDIQYPEYSDLSEEAVSRFDSAGVSAKVYYEACKFVASATGDKDADGNTISGSKKEKVMKYIASLNISDSQKDSLWNAIKGSWKGSWR